MATGGPIGTVDAPNETSATGACHTGRSLVASNQLIPPLHCHSMGHSVWCCIWGVQITQLEFNSSSDSMELQGFLLCRWLFVHIQRVPWGGLCSTGDSLLLETSFHLHSTRVPDPNRPSSDKRSTLPVLWWISRNYHVSLGGGASNGPGKLKS